MWPELRWGPFCIIISWGCLFFLFVFGSFAWNLQIKNSYTFNIGFSATSVLPNLKLGVFSETGRTLNVELFDVVEIAIPPGRFIVRRLSQYPCDYHSLIRAAVVVPVHIKMLARVFLACSKLLECKPCWIPTWPIFFRKIPNQLIFRFVVFIFYICKLMNFLKYCQSDCDFISF